MKRTRLLILVYFLLFSTCIRSQNSLFEKRHFYLTSFESGYSHISTLDSGFALVKSFAGFNGMSKALIKTDSDGNIVWTAHLQWPMQISHVDLAQGPDSSYFMVSLDSSNVSAVFKIDVSGTVLWMRKYAISTQQVFFTGKPNIIASADGGCIVETELINANSFDWHLMKIDANGNLLWSQSVYQEPLNDPGFQNFCECPNGDILVVGQNITMTTMYSTIVRVGANGTFISGKIYPSSPMIILTSIKALADNGAVFSGYAYPGAFVAGRIDILGNILWYKRYNIASSIIGYTEITAAPDGGWAIAGGDTNGYLLKIDSLGMSQWITEFDTIDFSCLSLSNTGYALSGMTPSYNNLLVTVDQSGMNSCNHATTTNTLALFTSNPIPLTGVGAIAITSSIPTYAQLFNTIQVYTPCFTSTNLVHENESDEMVINIYPLPVSDEINIESKHIIESILLTDISGKTIISEKIGSLKTKLDTRTIKSGVYFLTIKSEEKTSTRKLIIQH
jgi:Secretion system C-terminal sorting domain